MTVKLDVKTLIDEVQSAIESVENDVLECSCDECGDRIETGEDVYCDKCINDSKVISCSECNHPMETDIQDVYCSKCVDAKVEKAVEEATTKYREALEQIRSVCSRLDY